MPEPMTPRQFVRDALWDRYEDVDRADEDFADLVEAGVDEDVFIASAMFELAEAMREAFASGRALVAEFDQG